MIKRKEKPLIVSKMDLSETKNFHDVKLIKIGYSNKFKTNKYLLLQYHKPISALSCWYKQSNQ
jgi:hypothetical protein